MKLLLLFFLLMYSHTTILSGETVVVGQSLFPTNNIIVAGHPATSLPPNCVILPNKEKTIAISKMAQSFLGGGFGTLTPFQIGDQYFVARVEPHYHQPPPPDVSVQQLSKYSKPWGWHKGVTIYKCHI